MPDLAGRKRWSMVARSVESLRDGAISLIVTHGAEGFHDLNAVWDFGTPEQCDLTWTNYHARDRSKTSLSEIIIKANSDDLQLRAWAAGDWGSNDLDELILIANKRPMFPRISHLCQHCLR